MICIVRIQKGLLDNHAEPTGWIIASSIDDARRKAESVGEIDIVQALDHVPQTKSCKRKLTENIWLLGS